MIKIDILLAVVCAQADHVALVCHDVDELELAIEPADSRVGLSKLLAYLDGKAKRCASANWKLTMGCAIQGEPQ